MNQAKNKAEWSVKDVLAATDGTLASGDAEAQFNSISTDSRSIRNGELFVALSGDNFDGHEYIESAIAHGAAGFLVNQRFLTETIQTDSRPIIEVPDTLTALGDLASFHLERLGVPVIAVTGSTGKTTTKEMIAEVMSKHFDGQILKTEGNFNNLIGLPLTVFRLSESHRVAVLEMGMSMRGEIRRLAQIARPQIGIITNVSAVHLEHLKTIGAVAKAKGELIEDFGADHFAVLNADDERVAPLARGRDFKSITFGIENEAIVSAVQIVSKRFEGIDFSLKIEGREVPVHLSCVGRHNVYNALAAASAAFAFGVPVEAIVEGLEAFRPAAMRSRILDIFGRKVIDDTYNANPSSMDAALGMLVDLADGGRMTAVLGDMFELGGESNSAHRRLGRHAARLGLESLYLLGEQAPLVANGAAEEKMSEEKIHIMQTHKEIVNQLRDSARRGDVILVKGSRGMRMERIVKGLKGEPV